MEPVIPHSPVGEPWPLWVYTDHGTVLHVAVEVDEPRMTCEDDWWTSGGGTTLCGLHTHLARPGVWSRLNLNRCRHCCRAMGIPPGVGHPKNDPALRPVFGYVDVPRQGLEP